MDNREEIAKELEAIAPRLARVEKKYPFREPDFYFQTFPDRMLERTRQQTPLVTSWITNLEQRLTYFFELLFRPRYAVPASAFLLALVVGWNILQTQKKADQGGVLPLAEVSTEEINEFAIENFEEVDLIATNISVEEQVSSALSTMPVDDLKEYLQSNSDNQTLEEML